MLPIDVLKHPPRWLKFLLKAFLAIITTCASFVVAGRLAVAGGPARGVVKGAEAGIGSRKNTKLPDFLTRYFSRICGPDDGAPRRG
jgi:hypothetical protein